MPKRTNAQRQSDYRARKKQQREEWFSNLGKPRTVIIHDLNTNTTSGLPQKIEVPVIEGTLENKPTVDGSSIVYYQSYWECRHCGYTNTPNDRLKCAMCGYPHSEDNQASWMLGSGDRQMRDWQNEQWKKHGCKPSRDWND